MDIQTVHEQTVQLKQGLSRIIVGQDHVLHSLVTTLLAGGHALLEGAPGTAKTLTARTLAKLTGTAFQRIQFTPDLMPSDIIGVNLYNTAKAEFVFQAGPLFTEILLADEINRAPAKTQSALLEAMEERQVTVDGECHTLPPVFTVFATQNPIEFEGTYPLPEAQVDRFMMKILVDYPGGEFEATILDHVENGIEAASISEWPPLLETGGLQQMRQAVRQVHMKEDVRRYITRLVTASRRLPQVLLGASPRTGVQWMYAAKAAAVMEGRDFATPDDVKSIARPMLRHRLLIKPEVEVEGMTADQCIQKLLNEVESPE